jgi:ribosomal protein L29
MKNTRELSQKTVAELEKDIASHLKEITKIKLEFKVNPPKDSNAVSKLKRQIAILKTLIAQKHQA